MYIPGGNLYTKDKTSLITGCVGFVSKLTLMFAFYKHSAVGISDRYRFLYGFLRTATTLRWVLFIVIVLNGLLS